MKKLTILTVTAVILATGAMAESSSTPAPAPETNSQEILKETTHGRSMLARTDKSPEDGRLMRAIAACIRYYTQGAR